MANKSAVLSVKIVGDSKNLQGALRRAAKSVDAEMGRIQNASKRLTAASSAALRLAANFTAVGLLSSGLLVASANAATLAGSLLSVVGILPVLPGLLAGFAVGAVVTGMALKDIGTVLADLGPSFTALQDQVSSKFWDKAAAPIRSLVKTTLPALQAGLTETASAAGEFFGELAYSLENNLTPQVMGYLFKPLIESIQIAKAAVGLLVEAFVTLGAVGGQYLPRLAHYFVELSDRFNNFIQTADSNGSLTKWIDGGIFAMQELGRVIGGVGGILKGIFTAAEAAGGSTLTTLADGLARVSSAVNGPAFQGALTTLFLGAKDALSNVSVALKPLGDLFVKLAPTLATILSVIGTLAGTVLVTLASVISQNQPLIDNLTNAFQVLGVIVQIVGGFISQNAELFTALLVVVGTLTAAISIATTVTGIFNAVMAINPIALVVIAVAALVAGIIYLATQTTVFQDIWRTMTTAAITAWTIFVSFVRSFFAATFANITAIINGFLGLFGTNLNSMKAIWSAGFQYMLSIGQNAINGIRGAFNGIVSAVQNAIGWVRSLFNMGGMPGWLKGVLGMGGTGFEFVGTFAALPVPGQLGLGMTGGGFSGSSFSGGSAPAPIINNYNVTVNGALDADAVGRQLEDILTRRAKSSGRQAAGVY